MAFLSELDPKYGQSGNYVIERPFYATVHTRTDINGKEYEVLLVSPDKSNRDKLELLDGLWVRFAVSDSISNINGDPNTILLPDRQKAMRLEVMPNIPSITIISTTMHVEGVRSGSTIDNIPVVPISTKRF